jgi:hypothetical protein
MVTKDYGLYLSQKIVKLYVRFLGGYAASVVLGANGVNGQGTQWYTNGSLSSYEGIPIFMANGLGAV